MDRRFASNWCTSSFQEPSSCGPVTSCDGAVSLIVSCLTLRLMLWHTSFPEVFPSNGFEHFLINYCPILSSEGLCKPRWDFVPDSLSRPWENHPISKGASFTSHGCGFTRQWTIAAVLQSPGLPQLSQPFFLAKLVNIATITIVYDIYRIIVIEMGL
jgi:hypothetical protein